MKFIDKETFFKYLDYWVKEEDKHLPPNDNWYVSVKITAEESEVEAIPIEWLHNIMKKQLIFAMNSEMEGTTTVQDGVIHCVSGALACQVVANVIELWEKENDKI